MCKTVDHQHQPGFQGNWLQRCALSHQQSHIRRPNASNALIEVLGPNNLRKQAAVMGPFYF